MSELLSRAGALFVAPRPPVARTAPSAPPPPDLSGVLASADLLPSVAGGLAASLRHAHRSRTALVLTEVEWRGSPPSLAVPRALARRLAERGLEATAAGALIRVTLPVDDGVRSAWRAITAVPDVPVVVALSARSDAYDGLLAQADRLHLAFPPDADPALTEIALASLATLGPPTSLLTPLTSFATRRLATLGLARLSRATEGVPA